MKIRAEASAFNTTLCEPVVVLLYVGVPRADEFQTGRAIVPRLVVLATVLVTVMLVVLLPLAVPYTVMVAGPLRGTTIYR